MTMPLSKGKERSLSKKLMLQALLTAIQFKTYRRFWTGMSDSKMISFGRMVFFPLLKFRDLQNRCQAALKLFWQCAVAQRLTKTLYVGCSFNFSPVCT